MKKPGAEFSFQPKDSLASTERPEFWKSLGKSRPNLALDSILQPPRHDAMVNERASAKPPLQPVHPNGCQPSSTGSYGKPMQTSTSSSQPQDPRETRADSPDFMELLKYKLHGTEEPHYGHGHGQVMSSLKQKAAKATNVFLPQKTRPEHHRDTSRVVPRPTAPVFQDRKAEPPKIFSSLAPDAHPANYGEVEFYTDPTKASADLKALLEGGMDEDEDGEKEANDGSMEGLKVKLLPHQVEGVEWMRGRELGPVKKGKVPKGGILADDMGLGKTLQTVSLILSHQKPADKDAEGWKKHFEGIEKTTLVVAPLALIRQWEAEIKEKVLKSHGLKVLVHHGPQRTKRFKDLALYDVVITTYQVLVAEHKVSDGRPDGVKAGCFGLHWWRVVLDEAHTIKNRNAKLTKACNALRAEYRWCLTGTPMQNNLEELQSLIAFLRITPYNNLKEWKEWIENPIRSGEGHVAIRRLHSLLRCFMKRRTKEILKNAGALNPGGKLSAEGEASVTGFKVTERKVVSVAATFSPAERRFYTRLEARADASIEAMLQGRVSYANALVLLLRLRQACNHPKLVEGKLDRDRDFLGTDVSQKTTDADVDAVADLLGGMSIVATTCNICGRPLPKDNTAPKADMCRECYDDLVYFNTHETAERKKPKRKAKIKNVVKEIKVEAQPKPRRQPRNRNIIADDSDEGEEEAEGRWLVPEGERGELKLGRAGGEEDENAEGGGEWLGDDDSHHASEDEDGSQLDSFIVKDEEVKAKGIGDFESDDSLPSFSAIKSQVASQEQLRRASPLRSGSNSDSDNYETASENSNSDDDSGIDESELMSDYDAPLRPPTTILASAKIRQLLEILHKEVHEHKFIVFSQFTSMLDLVEPFFRKEGIKFTRYDGQMRNDEREASLNSLRKDKNTRVLLCSLKCGSLGLNLTAATRVVILEPFWNPFVEEQAIDRVHRLTQTVDVVVYKITVENTVEGRILDLQERKRELAEHAIEGGMKKDGFKLGVKEILELFKHGGAALTGPMDFSDDALTLRDNAIRMRSLVNPQKPRRPESETWGRRWG